MVDKVTFGLYIILRTVTQTLALEHSGSKISASSIEYLFFIKHGVIFLLQVIKTISKMLFRLICLEFVLRYCFVSRDFLYLFQF